MSLTPAQEAFAQLVAAGKSQAEAYRTAYPKAAVWKPETVWNRASALMREDEVLARVEQIRAELAERGLWSREQSARALIEIVQAGGRDSDRIKAVCELNKMHGYHEPEKHEHSGPGSEPLRVVYVSARGK